MSLSSSICSHSNQSFTKAKNFNFSHEKTFESRWKSDIGGQLFSDQDNDLNVINETKEEDIISEKDKRFRTGAFVNRSSKNENIEESSNTKPKTSLGLTQQNRNNGFDPNEIILPDCLKNDGDSTDGKEKLSPMNKAISFQNVSKLNQNNNPSNTNLQASIKILSNMRQSREGKNDINPPMTEKSPNKNFLNQNEAEILMTNLIKKGSVAQINNNNNHNTVLSLTNPEYFSESQTSNSINPTPQGTPINNSNNYYHVNLYFNSNNLKSKLNSMENIDFQKFESKKITNTSLKVDSFYNGRLLNKLSSGQILQQQTQSFSISARKNPPKRRSNKHNTHNKDTTASAIQSRRSHSSKKKSALSFSDNESKTIRKINSGLKLSEKNPFEKIKTFQKKNTIGGREGRSNSAINVKSQNKSVSKKPSKKLMPRNRAKSKIKLMRTLKAHLEENFDIDRDPHGFIKKELVKVEKKVIGNKKSEIKNEIKYQSKKLENILEHIKRNCK